MMKFLVGLMLASLPISAHAMGEKPVHPAPSPSPSASPSPVSYYQVPVTTPSQCPAPNPNAKDLFDAIQAGSSEQVSQILQSELIAFDALNQFCERPLQMAIRLGNNEIISVLKSFYEKLRPLDYRSPLENGYSYEQYTFKFGTLALVNEIEGQSPLQNGDEKNAALFLAVQGNSLDVVNHLLAEGANPRLTTQGAGETLLMAVGNNEHGKEVAQRLLQLGLDVNAADQAYSFSPLIYVAGGGSSDQTGIAGVLIAAGADLNGKSNYGSPLTALVDSASPEMLETAKLLIRSGADVNARVITRYTGSSALVAASSTGESDLVSLLVAAGADVKNSDALSYAVCQSGARHSSPADALSVTKILLQAGADPSSNSIILPCAVGGNFGRAPSAELVKLLIASGVRVNGGDFPALMYAVQQSLPDTPQIVQELIQAGAEVNVADADSYTALMRAAINGSAEVIRILIRAGANLNARSQAGTAYDIAKAAGRSQDILDLLKPSSN